ncbi:MAG: hypothetical protein ACRDV2_01245 [Actinomycetes bacterium]
MTAEPLFSASCPDCGDVDLRAEQLWLVLTSPPGHAHYDFHCPGCTAHVQRHADPATVTGLAELVPVEELEVPQEALEPPDGDTLTMADLIDLMLSLEAPSGSEAQVAAAA